MRSGRRHYVTSDQIVVSSHGTLVQESMTDPDSDPEPRPRGVLPSRRSHDGADVERVDPHDVLDRLRVLQVHSWQTVAGDASGVERLGPAAEDFHEMFEAGADPDHITAGDADGVAIAAIQGLADRLDDQDARIERQDRRLQQQRALIDEQRTDIETLRERLGSIQAELTRCRLDADERE